MKDRLEELKERVNSDEIIDFNENLAYDNPAYQESEPTASSIERFFQDVSELSLALKKLAELSESVEKKQGEVLCSTTETGICEGKKQLNALKSTFTADATQVQARLSGMKAAMAQDHTNWMAEYRIRQSQFAVLTNRYRDIISQHYVEETKYIGRLKEQIKRQTELAGLDLQEDEINRLVDSPMGPQIVGKDLEVLKAKQHLAMAQERHRQLLDLEAQITELHSLFLHLDVLVLEQNDVINSIELNVLQSLDYISQSNEEVKKALKYERQSRLSAALAAVLGLCACCTCMSCAAGAAVR
ncbi:syntaxin-3-like [Ambystoma mexicanum]|uniref:syntaxin-3-like n=1 Tax=Ambystoma mexicanum TaxID=8296 RepID=UPI0037E92211